MSFVFLQFLRKKKKTKNKITRVQSDTHPKQTTHSKSISWLTSINWGKVAFVGRSVIRNFMFLCSTNTGPFGLIDLVVEDELWGTRALPVGIFMLFVSKIIQFIALMAYRSPILHENIKISLFTPFTGAKQFQLPPHSCCAWHQSPESIRNSIKVRPRS